jgi:2-oxoglutarate ferredoxin oxidoreductase subunit alpha
MKKTIIFAGEAGQGIDRTAVIFGKIAASLGYSVFIYRDYSSLIRGGHNFSIVTFSRNVVRSHDIKTDVLIALDQKSVVLHKDSLNKNGVVFSAEDAKTKGDNKHAVNNVLLGMLANHFSLPKETGIRILKKEFREKSAEAEKAYIVGYSKNIPKSDLKSEKSQKPLELSDGNRTVALGAIEAGVKAAFYYPMTPATGVFAKLEEIKEEKKIIVEQMEDEIAAANATLGAGYAGTLAMTGSSGGGLALMSEAVSFAGMAELPVVFYAAQRMGPSTGVPTYTSQGDLKFVLNIGPGEFPRLVLVPGDAEEAYEATRRAFYFATKYRMPVFIISDKHIAESYSTHDVLKSRLPKIKPLSKKAPKNYKSYLLTENGVSPAILPGGSQVFRATSYEHDEYGHTTEDGKLIKEMNDKRLRKATSLQKELSEFSGIALYGKGAKQIIFSGSPKGAVLDALPKIKDHGAIQINRLEPFPKKELIEALGNKPFYTVENNSTGQLAALIKEATGLQAKKSLLRYDGRPFSPTEVIDFFK